MSALVWSTLVSLSFFVVGTIAECQTGPTQFKFPPTFDSSISGRVIYNNLTRPRGVKLDSANPPNLLVVDSGVGVIALTQTNNASCNGWMRKVVVQNQTLNHGIEVQGTQLFASTADVALLWNYTAASASVSGNPQTIVKNMGNKDHSTRTLLYQPGSPPHLIITRGSDSNIDVGAVNVSTGRSQIRRFALTSNIPSGGYDWLDGELLAWGMRNAVGIALSHDGSRLWEVENSADEITYQSFDVHEDNPAEELNLVDFSNPSSLGAFYGYPNCLTVWNFTSDNGPGNLTLGDQFSINTTAGRDDTWCKNETLNKRPVLSFQAHSAPLDIKFYATPPASGASGGLPKDWVTHAFVSMHGSWDRTRPTGYSLVRIPWSGNAPAASSTAGNGYQIIMQPPDLSVCDKSCIRPVGMDFDSAGKLYVSSDATGEVFIVERKASQSSATGPASSFAIVSFCFALIHLVMLI